MGETNGTRKAGRYVAIVVGAFAVLGGTYAGGQIIATDLWGLATEAYVDQQTEPTARLARYLACREREREAGRDPSGCDVALEPGDLPDLSPRYER